MLVFSSCYKVMDYDNSDYQPLLVLNGFLMQDSVIKVNVSRTLSMLEIEYEADCFIDDAIVSLYINDAFSEKLKYDSIGFYHSTKTAENGHIYKITVEKDGYETAIGTVDMSKEFNIQLSNFEYSTLDTSFEYNADTPYIYLSLVQGNFDVIFQDEPEEKNYYGVTAKSLIQEIVNAHYYLEDTSYVRTELRELGYADTWGNFNVDDFATNQILQRDYIEYHSFGRNSFQVLDDDFVNIYQNNLNYSFSYLTPEVEYVDIFIYTFPEVLIKYSYSQDLYYDTQFDPFAEPVNIYSNIENGAGFLVGITAKKFTFELQ